MSEWKSHITQLMNFLDKDHEDAGTQLLNELSEMLSRANEPDTVSVEALHRLASLEPNGFFRKGWLTAIDHLRKQHPNGVKWED